MKGHDALTFDTLYSSIGCFPRSELAVHLGAALDDRNYIVADEHQRTRIKNLSVAGDVANGS